MQTEIPAAAGDTLRATSELGGITVTEAVRQVVSVHKFMTDAQTAGSLVVSFGASVEALTLSDVEDDGRRLGLDLNVSPVIKEYIAPYAEPDDGPQWHKFWLQGTGIYSKIAECHALKTDLRIIRPDESIQTISFASMIPLVGDDGPKRNFPFWRRRNT